jgi:hypothetical protein
MGIVRRVPAAMPRACATPSWNCWAGTWQLAHDTDRSRLNRVSLNRRLPSAAASGLFSTALDASCGCPGGDP